MNLICLDCRILVVKSSMNYRILFAALLTCLMNSIATAQVQFHLAYMQPTTGTVPTTFLNDGLFKFVSVEPLIRADELKKARAFLLQGQATVEIIVSTSARKKFNNLATLNVLNQKKGAFEKHVGLAVMVDGKPAQVIQGVFQSLPENKMWWSPADDRLPPAEQLRISKEFAAKIGLTP